MFVPMKFNGDVFFELPPIENPEEHSCHMYRMTRYTMVMIGVK
jgi:hypothetical protein